MLIGAFKLSNLSATFIPDGNSPISADFHIFIRSPLSLTSHSESLLGSKLNTRCLYALELFDAWQSILATSLKVSDFKICSYIIKE